MKEDYYISQSGDLIRKGNTIYFKSEETSRALPVEHINALYVFGEVNLNKRFLELLNEKNIPIHFYNYHNFYVGSYMPRDHLISGFVIVKQAENYLNDKKRIYLAREFLDGATHNILSNLKYYLRKGKDLENHIEKILGYRTELKKTRDVPAIMGIEGNIRKVYYKSFNEILREGFIIKARVKRPPDNMVNCMISFGNSLLYRTILTEIYHTYLHPAVSYLHQPSDGRFSLSLDLAEVFKPIIVDQVIFALVNKQKIAEKHFDKKINYCYLNEKGRTVFLKEYDEKMHTTLYIEKLKRKVSYKRLLRLEC